MQILKGKKDRGHEINMYASHVSNPVVRDLNKIASRNKAYRETAKSLKFDEWVDEETGDVFATSGEYFDHRAVLFMKAYPAQFARTIKPELTLIVQIDGNPGVIWNDEAVKIAYRLHDDWRVFSRKMDHEVLEWDGFDFEADPYNIDRPDIMQKALDAALNRLEQIRKDNIK